MIVDTDVLIWYMKGNEKAYKTIELLGCSIPEFKEYLEKLFKDGMNWDNYGYYGWHVDHILPCAYFDLSDPKQQRLCFHYTNLQPLWSKDNYKKSCSVCGGISTLQADA